MEQLSFDEFSDKTISIKRLQSILSAIETKNELIAGTLELKENKVKSIVVGYSVYLKKELAAKVKVKTYSLLLHKKLVNIDIISGYVYSKDLQNPKGFVEFEFEDPDCFWSSFQYVINTFLASYVPTERFGCCHRYVECSDAKKCIAPDKIHAKGCIYKDNLEKGKIFYGKNKNIF